MKVFKADEKLAGSKELAEEALALVAVMEEKVERELSNAIGRIIRREKIWTRAKNLCNRKPTDPERKLPKSIYNLPSDPESLDLTNFDAPLATTNNTLKSAFQSKRDKKAAAKAEHRGQQEFLVTK